MCGRYLVDDEVYADMWMIMNGSDAGLSPTPHRVFAPNGEMNPPGVQSAAAGREIFPANTAPIVTSTGYNAIKWGFPHWKGKGVIINARAETAFEKKMFSKALSKQRCVVPSCGYYEWGRSGAWDPGAALPGRADRQTKSKYLFRHPGGALLFMAGIADIFRDSSGEEYSAFVILTTAANESTLPIHDRMPVVLAPEERDLWIHDDGFTKHALGRTGPGLVFSPARR